MCLPHLVHQILFDKRFTSLNMNILSLIESMQYGKYKTSQLILQTYWLAFTTLKSNFLKSKVCIYYVNLHHYGYKNHIIVIVSFFIYVHFRWQEPIEYIYYYGYLLFVCQSLIQQCWYQFLQRPSELLLFDNRLVHSQ